MSEERNMFKKLHIGRKQILIQLFFEVSLGVFLGFVCKEALCAVSIVKEDDVNVVALMLLFVVMVVFLWTPLWLPGGQVYDISKDKIQMIPTYSTWKRWKMILHILCKNDISLFMDTIALSSLQGGKLCVERHAGSWAYSRYTYVLILCQEHRTISLLINPMDNGVFLPAGKGGFTFQGYQSREDICNLVRFFKVQGIPIDDPYHIVDALKNPEIEMYDYLESLHITTRY